MPPTPVVAEGHNNGNESFIDTAQCTMTIKTSSIHDIFTSAVNDGRCSIFSRGFLTDDAEPVLLLVAHHYSGL